MRKLSINKVYRHFKGGFYTVIATALHTETNEELVIYRSVSDPTKFFARPINMFLSKVCPTKYPYYKQPYRMMTLDEIEEVATKSELEEIIYSYECALTEKLK